MRYSWTPKMTLNRFSAVIMIVVESKSFQILLDRSKCFSLCPTHFHKKGQCYHVLYYSYSLNFVKVSRANLPTFSLKTLILFFYMDPLLKYLGKMLPIFGWGMLLSSASQKLSFRQFKNFFFGSSKLFQY